MSVIKDIKPILWTKVAKAFSPCLLTGNSISRRTLVVIETAMIIRIYTRKRMKLNFLSVIGEALKTEHYICIFQRSF